MAGEALQGQPVTGEGTKPVASTALASEAIRAKNRAAFLAAVTPGGELADEPAKPVVKAPAKPADDLDDDEDLDEGAKSDDDDDEDDEDLDEEDPAEVSAEAKKRIAQIKAEERRSRETLTKERAEFDRERETFVRERRELATKIDAFEKLVVRAKSDPVSVLKQLGLTEEDFDFAASQIYAHGKTLGADPKNRERAAQASRERDDRERLSGTAKELADLKAELAQRDQHTTAKQQLDAFFDGAIKQVGDAQPLLKRALEKNPAGTRAKLAQIAYELSQKTGAMPSEQKLVRVYERRRRAELDELGIDHSAITGNAPAVAAAAAKKTTTTKVPPQTAEKNPSAETSPPNGTVSAAPGVESDKQRRRRLIAEMPD